MNCAIRCGLLGFLLLWGGWVQADEAPSLMTVEAAFAAGETERARDLIKQALAGSDGELQYELGRMLEQGVPVKAGNPLIVPDFPAAVQCFERSSVHPSAKRVQAQVALAKLLLDGVTGPAQDHQQRIIRLLDTAAKTGYAEAAWVLGEIVQRGTFSGADPDSAKTHYRSALQGGHPQAALALAQLTQADNTREADDYAKLGRAILLKRALGGDPDSARKLADIYRKGVFVTVDMEQARHWYEQAAAAGDRHVLITLAKAYDNRGWLQPAPERVTAFYRRAAQAGSLQAALALSNRYATGEKSSVTADEAVLWLERAVAVGSLQAMLKLANWYGQGNKGVEQDKDRAKRIASSRRWCGRR
ncbi:MAG: sel1 repeat family protein [Candidatus Competibacteraceae bacterium]|nr:sel1 repeat family protein [Candidatus Competibacteraceae bacterium]